MSGIAQRGSKLGPGPATAGLIATNQQLPLLAGHRVTKANDPEAEITDLRPCVPRKCEETGHRLHLRTECERNLPSPRWSSAG